MSEQQGQPSSNVERMNKKGMEKIREAAQRHIDRLREWTGRSFGPLKEGCACVLTWGHTSTVRCRVTDIKMAWLCDGEPVCSVTLELHNDDFGFEIKGDGTGGEPPKAKVGGQAIEPGQAIDPSAAEGVVDLQAVRRRRAVMGF